MKQKKQPNNFSWENIKTINDKKFPRGGGSVLRIGRWVVNGKPMSITIERREYYDLEEGKSFRKAKGLSFEDAQYIAENWGDLEFIMQGRKPIIQDIVISKNGHSDDF